MLVLPIFSSCLAEALRSQRNATQRNATQRNATQRSLLPQQLRQSDFFLLGTSLELR
jgi:hypothetical protein